MTAGEPRHPVLHFLRRVRAAAPGPGAGDAELLRRFAAGRDEAAFELLVWRHGAMVLRVCRGVLRDAHAAEDAFQAAFLALARKAASVARHGSPAGWLYRVAYRVALRARVAEARRADRESARSPRPLPPAADAGAEAAELAALLHEEVDRLAARYRTPVVLCYLEGKTHEEAARALGWPKGTVSGRLARARDLLRRRLTRRGVAFPAAGLAALLGETADAAVTGPLAAATARAAAGYVVGGASAAAASVTSSRLARGVIHAMFLVKVKAVTLSCLAVGVMAVGAGALARGKGAFAAPPQPGPAPAADAPGAPSEDPFLGASQRKESVNNLKQILLAMHNYHDVHKHFPGNITDKQGRPLLSWRVAILPFVEENALYNRFNLDEPWDSEHNKKFLASMPRVYRAPNQPKRVTETYYQGFSGLGTLFDPAGPVRISDVTDGTSNTLFVVEAGAPVPWTKPEDMPYDPKKPLPTLGGVFPDRIDAGFVDGSVRAMRKDIEESALRALITRNGGEVVDLSLELAPPRPDGQAGNEVDRLRAGNHRLERTVAALDVLIDRAREELTRLREEGARREESGAEARRLAGRNAALEEEVTRKQAELDKLRREITRLRKGAEK